MELETINRLYLELSQIATAKTAQQIALEKQCERRWKLIQDIYNDEETVMSRELLKRTSDELITPQHLS